jgi:hypothetical protein
MARGMIGWELRGIPVVWKIIGVGLLLFAVGMTLLWADIDSSLAETLTITGGVIMMISAVYLAFYRK